MIELSSTEQAILAELVEEHPQFRQYEAQLIEMNRVLVECFDRGGTLFICGNGGSHSDAIHIAGELCKSFERKRPVPPQLVEALAELPFGKALAENLESGLRAVALGLNGALKTAVENDTPVRDIAFAQELNVMARRGDVLLSLSTSGHATNCIMAMSTAKAKGLSNLALLGRDGGAMLELADVAIVAHGNSTRAIQEAHIVLWHRVCLLIEAHYFPIKR